MTTIPAIFLLFCCCYLMLGSGTGLVSSQTYPVTFSSQCDQGNPLLDEQLMTVIDETFFQLQCMKSCNKIRDCNSSATSGYYMIQAANGSSVQMYCDMEGTNCGGEGGWMRVAYLNMTDPSNQCLHNFQVATANDKRFCIRNTSSGGCRNIETKTLDLSYSKICGYVRGYSHSIADGLAHHINAPLSGNYVDGISITNGSPPSHVWTYVADLDEDTGSYPHSSCPCNSNINIDYIIPSYVGNDCYCEAGSLSHNDYWHTSDPLWDGQQCGGTEGPCCNIPGLPWFNKNISSPTTDSFKVQLCSDEANEKIAVEKVELYIK